MALRVAGDTHARERAPELELGEKRQGALETPEGRISVPAGTKMSSIPQALRRATISPRCASSTTSLAEMCGTTAVSPCPTRASVESQGRLEALSR